MQYEKIVGNTLDEVFHRAVCPNPTGDRAGPVPPVRDVQLAAANAYVEFPVPGRRKFNQVLQQTRILPIAPRLAVR